MSNTESIQGKTGAEQNDPSLNLIGKVATESWTPFDYFGADSVYVGANPEYRKSKNVHGKREKVTH